MTRAYCDFLLAVTYSTGPAQITAILGARTQLLGKLGRARPGAHPDREFVNRWTTDGSRSTSATSIVPSIASSRPPSANRPEKLKTPSSWGTDYQRGFGTWRCQVRPTGIRLSPVRPHAPESVT